jgi:hypothetical protein
VLDVLAEKYPQAYFGGMVALSKVMRWETATESGRGGCRSKSGSLAMLAAMRRASSRINSLVGCDSRYCTDLRCSARATRIHCADFILSIEPARLRLSTKRMAIGRPATAPAMPALKCSGVQRLSAASTAAR